MLRIAALLLLLCGAVVINAQTPGPMKIDQGEAEVMATIARWADAVRDRDMKALEQLFEDEMIVTAFDGTTRGKKQELEVLKPDANVKTVSVSNEDIRIRRFDSPLFLLRKTADGRSPHYKPRGSPSPRFQNRL